MSVIITRMNMPKNCNSYPDCCLREYCSPTSINVELERPKGCPLKSVEGLIEEVKSRKINIEVECAYCDPTGMLSDKYEKVNDVIDEIIEIIKKYCKEA